MKTIFKALALASLSVTALSMTAVPAAAQSKLGIAVVNVDQAVGTSSAATTARSQMQVTYKATIDSLNTRKTALEAELKTKGEALQAAVKAAAGKPSPALQTQYEALQKRQQEAQVEMQRLGQPLALANAYVEEQITAKLGDALKNAMKKANVDLVIAPDATISYAPTVDITAMVVTELNALVPAVGIVPPAGWQPGQQQAAPAAAAPAASAQPTGR